MKRPIVIVIASIVFLIVSSVYYYFDTYRWQLGLYRDMLADELSTGARNYNQYFSEAKNNILLLINEEELSGLFKFNSPKDNQGIRNRINLLYNRYDNVLIELKVIDTSGNSYSLSKGDNNVFISCYQKLSKIEGFKEQVAFNDEEKNIIYNQPLYSDTYVYGYVVLTMKSNAFYDEIFKNFAQKDNQIEWIVNESQGIVYATNKALKLCSECKDEMALHKDYGWLIHNVYIEDRKQTVLTTYRTLKAHNEDVKMGFSVLKGPITKSILKNFILVGVVTTLVVLLVMAAFVHQINKNRINAKRLSQSEEALRKVLYYLPVGVILLDKERRIRQVNKAALNIFEYEDEDLLINTEGNHRIIFEKKKVLQKVSITSSSNKFVFAGPQGEKQVILNESIPFYLQHELYTIEVFIEITPVEQFQGEDATHATLAKNTFIANISHELRTPLNGIIGMTDIILLSNNMPDRENEMLCIVKRSADTLLALINDILDFSKIESGKLEVESIPFNLKQEVENVIGEFSLQAKQRRLDLSWESSIDLPEDYIGDPLRIKQILTNLIGNSLKFTAEGEVKLSIDKSRSVSGAPVLQFTISDTGIGIKRNKIQEIFQSFSQEDQSTTRQFGGTGLGTSISKHLVNLMGGDIWANSPSAISYNPEYPGAEFCFTLPYVTKTEEKGLDFSFVFSFSQIHSLIISDDELQVSSITRNMMALGMKYKILSPSQETILFLKSSQHIQILVVDQRPDFNGLDFLQELYNHDLHKNYLIMLQSSDYDKLNTKISRKLGADIYLRKPVKIEIFKNFILKYFVSIKDKKNLAGKIVDQNLKILLVEDNFFNQKVACSLFHNLGFSIDIANDGIEALEKSKGEKYDIVFMDVYMPRLNGFDTTKELKEMNAKCPIIAMTANAESVVQEQAYNSGMDDIIVKPAQREEISRMLLKWCAQ